MEDRAWGVHDAARGCRCSIARFNDRDIETVPSAMTPDVDWPNGWEGGRLIGHDNVYDFAGDLVRLMQVLSPPGPRTRLDPGPGR